MDREEEIKQIAYKIWEEEGYQHGVDMDHWFRAEAIWEISSKPKKSVSPRKVAAKKKVSKRKKASK